MTFEEWTDTYVPQSTSIIVIAEDAYEAGVQEGINRMYLLYDMCPECKETLGRHKMDCGRGR